MPEKMHHQYGFVIDIDRWFRARGKTWLLRVTLIGLPAAFFIGFASGYLYWKTTAPYFMDTKIETRLVERQVSVPIFVPEREREKQIARGNFDPYKPNALDYLLSDLNKPR